jgi:hypothetical protein
LINQQCDCRSKGNSNGVKIATFAKSNKTFLSEYALYRSEKAFVVAFYCPNLAIPNRDNPLVLHKPQI